MFLIAWKVACNLVCLVLELSIVGVEAGISVLQLKARLSVLVLFLLTLGNCGRGLVV